MAFSLIFSFYLWGGGGGAPRGASCGVKFSLFEKIKSVPQYCCLWMSSISTSSHPNCHLLGIPRFGGSSVFFGRKTRPRGLLSLSAEAANSSLVLKPGNSPAPMEAFGHMVFIRRWAFIGAIPRLEDPDFAFGVEIAFWIIFFFIKEEAPCFILTLYGPHGLFQGQPPPKRGFSRLYHDKYRFSGGKDVTFCYFALGLGDEDISSFGDAWTFRSFVLWPAANIMRGGIAAIGEKHRAGCSVTVDYGATG